MIYVDRTRVARPAILNSPEVHEAYKSANEFFSTPQSKRGQRRFEFNANLLAHPELRDALGKLFDNKCSYCESIMTWSIPENVSRYRPISKSIELDGTIFPDHYWWLMFDWDNLIPLCTECTRACGTRFPILGLRAHKGAVGDELFEEQPLLLNPSYDRPEEHLVFTADGQVVSSTRPGQVTIEVFNLNRPNLVENRRKVFVQYEAVKKQLMAHITQGARRGDSQAEEYLEILGHAGDADQPFAGMMRQILHTWIPSFGRFTEHTAQLNEARAKENREAQVHALLELANSTAELQDYQNAIGTFEEALKLADDLNDKMTALLAHRGLGEVYELQKDYPKAIRHLEKSMQMAGRRRQPGGSVKNLPPLSRSSGHAGGETD
jgi:hypothetical protein